MLYLIPQLVQPLRAQVLVQPQPGVLQQPVVPLQVPVQELLLPLVPLPVQPLHQQQPVVQQVQPPVVQPLLRLLYLYPHPLQRQLPQPQQVPQQLQLVVPPPHPARPLLPLGAPLVPAQQQRQQDQPLLQPVRRLPVQVPHQLPLWHPLPQLQQQQQPQFM